MLQRQAAPLREQAVAVLRQDIIRGEFHPGMRLTEKSLEQRLGVSRTVVREALRQLEAERLIRITPNVGPIVAELTREDAAQLYEVRAALEAVAAKLAARNRTQEQLEALTSTFRAIAMAENAPVEDMVALKDAFYAELITASGNPIIGEMLANVQARISQLRTVTLSSPGRGRDTTRELQSVIDAIINQDEESAQAASVAHVQSAAQIALSHLSAEQEQSDLEAV